MYTVHTVTEIKNARLLPCNIYIVFIERCVVNTIVKTHVIISSLYKEKDIYSDEYVVLFSVVKSQIIYHDIKNDMRRSVMQ